MKRYDIDHRFVDFIPDVLEEGVVYVSITYATAVHRCCCGCGGEVVTPLDPARWAVTFDGQSISLTPSIGNWSFPCQSHYWIERNRVKWARGWSRNEIDEGRSIDRDAVATKRRSASARRAKPLKSSIWSAIRGALGFRRR